MSTTDSAGPTPSQDGEAESPALNVPTVPSASLRVTQELLGRYEQLKSSAEERRAIRLEILRLLDEGAEIEPGPLTARLAEHEERRLTNRRLRDLLGAEWVEQLLSRVEPTRCRFLHVRSVVPTESQQAAPTDTSAPAEPTAPICTWGVPPTNPR